MRRLRSHRWARTGLVIVAGLAVSLIAAPQPASAAVATPKVVSTAPFAIKVNYGAYAAAAAALDALLPSKTVGNVMDDANYDRRALCNTSTLSALVGTVDGFCFNADDTADCHTFPQGLTTTRDATGGDYSGHQLVATSWYQKDECGGDTTIRSKIILTDWDADFPNMYRKLMLVKPYTDAQGRPTFSAYTMHTSGISWYGNYLYVSNGSVGLEVFDMRKIWQVSTGDGIGRQADGTYTSAGYKYVLPSVGTVRNAGSSGLQWSTLGLDRAKTSLVTTEWIETTGTKHAVRFPLDATTQVFKPGADGMVHASEALTYTYPHVQGAVSHNGRWWFGASSPKALYYWEPGAAAKSFTWVSVTEGLSYWEDADGPDLLWTVRENEGTRNVFTVEQAKYS
ncbi:hypothetical protein F4553_007919 [Allocatelliglobosispora scoriae]|uniref:Secreted protein n=1 Tax=Allocatelliglobosispora scoriae TaxID=643052 RepID=A0A841C3M0_9ACTN|nr:hypothetical protein [Allocatelliglobosispora scoriae]MBB5874485.1 hypothetical protein [Allocatelliglobosispora scoriae]